MEALQKLRKEIKEASAKRIAAKKEKHKERMVAVKEKRKEKQQERIAALKAKRDAQDMSMGRVLSDKSRLHKIAMGLPLEDDGTRHAGIHGEICSPKYNPAMKVQRDAQDRSMGRVLSSELRRTEATFAAVGDPRLPLEVEPLHAEIADGVESPIRNPAMRVKREAHDRSMGRVMSDAPPAEASGHPRLAADLLLLQRPHDEEEDAAMKVRRSSHDNAMGEVLRAKHAVDEECRQAGRIVDDVQSPKLDPALKAKRDAHYNAMGAALRAARGAKEDAAAAKKASFGGSLLQEAFWLMRQ
jgi:hypothetical protein